MSPLADKKSALKRLNSKILHKGEYINLRQDDLFKEEKEIKDFLDKIE